MNLMWKAKPMDEDKRTVILIIKPQKKNFRENVEKYYKALQGRQRLVVVLLTCTPYLLHTVHRAIEHYPCNTADFVYMLMHSSQQ